MLSWSKLNNQSNVCRL